MKTLLFIKDIIIRKHIKEFILTGFLLLSLTVFEVGAILMLAPFIDLITKPNLVGLSPLTLQLLGILKMMHLPANIYSVITVMLLFAIFRAIANILVYASVLKTKYVLVKNMVCDAFTTFFAARWDFFVTNRQGVLGNTFIRETSKMGDSFAHVSMMLVKSCQIVFYFGIAFMVSWQLSLVVVLISLVTILPFAYIGKFTYKLGQANLSTANQLYEIIQENLSAAKLAIGYDEQKKGSEMLAKAMDRHTDVTIKAQVIENGTPMLFQPVGMAIVLFSFLLSKVLINVSVAELAVIMFSFYTAMPLISQVMTLKNSLSNFFPSYEQVNNLMNIARKTEQPSGKVIFSKVKSNIIFENVSFKYPGQDQLLEGINLVIPRGKMIALVGKSGAGKSTIIDLILRFYDPDAGAILIDDVNLNTIDVHLWRKKLGYVPQDSFLFNISIRENLLWAKSDASDQQIQKTCKMANVDEFLAEMPEGLDTIVGDRGIRLSGGQRQRIALARAILREPEILILDEATSSLDSHSEKLIQQAIEEIANQTTVVVVAHRLSTVVNADRIYMIENGKVIEEGSFTQLCNSKGRYYELAKIQGVAA